MNIETVKIQNHDSFFSFSVGCEQIANDLKSLGIVERKSLVLQPPSISEQYYFDWIRGLFDADGGISYSEKIIDGKHI